MSGLHDVGSETYGRDLRCPTCGGMAVDVDPDYRLDPEPYSLEYHMGSQSWSSWKCAQGHNNCAHWVRRGKR